MKINITRVVIINLIWVILACSFVIFRQYNITQANELKYENKLEQQQTSHLEKLGEFTENYNGLQKSYNDLYIKYHKLAAEKGFYDGWELFECTAYTSLDLGCNNISASGINIEKWSNYFNFCAAPPEYELGTILLVKFDNNIEPFLVVDRGGAIQIKEDGMKHIDLYFVNDLSNAFHFGVKELEVKILR